MLRGKEHTIQPEWALGTSLKCHTEEFGLYPYVKSIYVAENHEDICVLQRSLNPRLESELGEVSGLVRRKIVI